MKKLYVDLEKNSYNIYFETDFNSLSDKIRECGEYKKILIVTDSNVYKLYSDEVKNKLLLSGFDVNVYSFTAGEENKNIDTILNICGACIEYKLDRKSLIIALGGGVVGDMAGFAASIYMRGIDFVQVPTTLLSQSDSSVGGKTGIDFMNAKNILGAFHQPRLVYINVNTLKTLPKREFISGMGEVIKHGIIRNKNFFYFLRDNKEMVSRLDADILLELAEKNCSIKADVVTKDEFENGLRADLNLGHTIGHAIEAYSYFKLTHGQCVGLGIIAASYISFNRGILSEYDFEEIKNIFNLYEFDNKTQITDVEKIFTLMQKDKKNQSGMLKFILPTSVGTVTQITDVTNEEMALAINYINTLQM